MKLFFKSRQKKGEKKKIFFAGVCCTNFIQFRPIYEILKHDQRIEIFFSGMYQSKDRPRELYKPFGIDKKFIIREKFAKLSKFDIYISPDYHMVDNSYSSTIQFFHTTSFRNFSVSQEARKFDQIFLIGPYMKRKFIEAGIFAAEDPRLKEVGMPQTDSLLDNIDTGLSKRLGLDENLPTILYAPVWAPIESFLEDVQKTLKALTTLKANLLLKLHDKFYYQQVNKIRWREYLDSILKENKNVQLINDFDIIPYMRISDLLVSDVSAVVHQFSILDKPIVCMKIDVDQFNKYWPSLDRQAYLNRAVVEANHGEALKEAVLGELANPERLSQKRLAMNQEYFYNIGSSAKCAVSQIYQLLSLGDTDESKTFISKKELVS
ncbi:MAG: CDP-glycerol glycerophosphotransferase family protein [Candidatus Omnitrophica bacterium]|nr:CDP-glycerol glycerophosphotransferase family protein [Candidatus Omnitrophota bacterium]MBU2251722.1 CDP-glycerol glycerophosphotransferase family protein [Candidatus Omnitrophota bacterium]MBU2266232.1 CDP-glycerol glycerophosphotransferase family protein [Candidatus Omnitrophota bacterium]